MIDDILAEIKANPKQIEADSVDSVISILKEYPDFAKQYNQSITISDAIDVYTDPNNAEVVRQINGVCQKKNVGVGEIVFVLLIKDCVSGGGASGDLILGDKVADIKALDKTTNIYFKLEYSSIIDLHKLPSIVALKTLIRFLVENEDAREYILKIIESNDVFVTHEKTYFSQFVREPNENEIGKSIFSGLPKLAKILNSIDAKETYYAEFRLGDKRVFAQVPSSSATAINDAIEHNKKFTVELTPIYDKFNVVTLPRLKSLEYITREIDRDQITSEILPHIKYTDGIVLTHADGSNPFYVSNDKFGQHLVFERLSKGVKFRFMP